MSCTCTRCGRNDHIVKNCFARYDIDGVYLSDLDDDEDEYYEDSTDDSGTDYLDSDSD